MSKEAMKLVLEGAANYIDALGGDSRKYRQALAEPDFWEGYVPEPVKPAQQALDKMAQNARELGLDYEPAPKEPLRVAKVGQRVHGPELLPPSVWRYQLKRVAWWFVLGILGMLWLAFLVACAAYAN